MNKKLLLLFFSLTIILIPFISSAADPTIVASTWFRDIICRFLNIVLWPVFLGLVIIMFIWAAILFLTAHGDPSKTTQAKKAVIWAVVGIVVAIVGFSAMTLVGKIIGTAGASLNCGATVSPPPPPPPPPPPTPPPSVCGNGICEAGEDITNCGPDCAGTGS